MRLVNKVFTGQLVYFFNKNLPKVTMGPVFINVEM